MKAFAPIGRFLFSAMFIISGINHFTQFDNLVGYARASGVPLPGLGVAASGFILLVGGLCVLLGAFTRIAAAGIALFLLLAAFLVHDFWTMSGEQAQEQMVNFLKNLSMAGGALLLVYFGPGPISLRSRRPGTSRQVPAAAYGPPLRARPQE